MQRARPHNTGVADKAKVALSSGLSALNDLAGLRHPLPLPVLLYFVFMLLPITFQLGPLNFTGLRLFLLPLVIPLTVQLFIGVYGRIILPDILFILHILWVFVAILANNPSYAIEHTGSTGIELWGGYLLGRVFIRSRENFISMIRLIAFVVMCCIPFAIYELATGIPPLIKAMSSLPGISSIVDVNPGQRLGLYRVQMVFPHPIHYGIFCAILLPMCWVGMRGIYSNTARLVVSACVLVSGFTALSSGALVAIALQLGLILWAYMARNIKRRWLFLLCLFFTSYAVLGLLSSRTPFQVFMTYATFSTHNAYVRVAIFDAGIQNVLASPFFGIGLNDWERPIWLSASVDNFWLLTAMRYGFVGLLFMLGGYIWAIVRIGLRNFESDIVLWQFRRAWMFSFIGLSISLATVHVWNSIFSFIFFMFGTGMWMLFEKPHVPEKTRPGVSDDDDDPSPKNRVRRKAVHNRQNAIKTKDEAIRPFTRHFPKSTPDTAAETRPADPRPDAAQTRSSNSSTKRPPDESPDKRYTRAQRPTSPSSAGGAAPTGSSPPPSRPYTRQRISHARKTPRAPDSDD